MRETLKILYEDNHLLAVFKPAGILIQGDKSGRRSLFEMARGYLKERYNKPGNVYLGMVHRLDRGTAGVVVFAKTSKAARRLSCEFRERSVRKVYWAIVEGMLPASGTLDNVLLRDRKKGNSHIINKMVPGAQKARLSYRVLKRDRGCSLIEVIPQTGRHHQIRAQLGASGYPIAGDTLYGAKKKLANGQIGLFAGEISFCHPVKKSRITIKAPLPYFICYFL